MLVHISDKLKYISKKIAGEIDPTFYGVQIGKSQATEITIQMYRGLEESTLTPSGTGYVIHPDRSEQGMLWFTHKYILRNIDPIDYAKNHGSILLTYPLKCIRHHVMRKIKDKEYEGVPDDIMSKVDPYNNCSINTWGIELPDGWLFSYKHEKFAVCKKPLQVTKNMLQIVKNIPEEEEPIFKLANLIGNIPEPGTLPIPAGAMRRFHVAHTKNLGLIKKQGLLLSSALGYEGPKAIYSWTNWKDALEYSGFPMGYNDTIIVEFYDYKENYKSSPDHTFKDISPQQILFIHELWHEYYRHLKNNNEDDMEYAIEKARKLNDPDYNKATKALGR